MQGLLCDIYGLYSEQVDLLDGFLSLSRRKTQIIRSGSLEDLETLIRAEEALLMQLSRIESKRRKALEMLRNELSLPAPLRMKDLARLLSSEDIARFEALSNRFADTVHKQRRCNRINKKLLSAKIGATNRMLDVLDRGRTKGNKVRSMLDTKG
ncbi:MAG: flagellar protein FlgN [Christensenellales bacterium]|jgi:flagellar biosynthesis/type III secretory pathway chaperone